MLKTSEYLFVPNDHLKIESLQFVCNQSNPFRRHCSNSIAFMNGPRNGDGI